jgi:hypothetical protein
MTDRHDPPAQHPIGDDDAPMTPAQMLALTRTQTDRVEDLFQSPTIAIVLTWGVAWTVGFLALWSASDASPVAVPAAPAAVVFGALMIAGVVVSAVVGTRTGAGVRGPQQVQGRIYGITWAIACVAVPVLSGALFRAGMTDELAALYFPAAYSLVIGILYLLGAALFSDRSMIVVGGWILLVGIVAPYVGAPGNYLVMALGGGGAFLAYGVALLAARARRRRRALEAPRHG